MSKLNNITNYVQMSLLILLVLLVCSTQCFHNCNHDIHSHNVTKHYYNDLSEEGRRLLQTRFTENGKIRIYVDYNQLNIGGLTQINTIKRVMNITTSYFYNVLNITRLNKLLFPNNNSLLCNNLNVPAAYTTDGVIGDFGVICANQQKQDVAYIAKSASCAFLQSNKRPIWGMITFNNVFLKYDQQGFQQILFVGIHQMTHLLGFSASMFQNYPLGNPLVLDPDTGSYFLKTPKIMQQIKNYYGCSGQLAKGLPLQDQDGTLIASHWQKKVIGNQYMIASNKKSSFVSRFTLALLDSTGWYTSVNYSYAQPNTWGQGKGCSFLSIDNCIGEQFCTNTSQFGCDWDGTGIGKCGMQAFSGSCMVYKYFTNTICIDQNYQLKNLNSNLNAIERGGSNSRCFISDFRQEGMDVNLLNNRCYISVCSASKRFLYILVGSYIMVCTKQGATIPAPPGLTGTLICPRTFKNYCQSKKTCPYHCNKNGACIDGQCLCTGQTTLSKTCIDVSILKAPIGTVGGLLNAFNDISPSLTAHVLNSQGIPPGQAKKASDSQLPQQDIKSYSINSKCLQGSTFDAIFGECLKCSEVFGCVNCNDRGCISCDDGKAPTGGKC